MLAEDTRPTHGAIRSFDAIVDDDDVLDQWLASLTPDELDDLFAGLASVGLAR